jgi:phage pi2 protein 07
MKLADAIKELGYNESQELRAYVGDGIVAQSLAREIKNNKYYYIKDILKHPILSQLDCWDFEKEDKKHFGMVVIRDKVNNREMNVLAFLHIPHETTPSRGSVFKLTTAGWTNTIPIKEGWENYITQIGVNHYLELKDLNHLKQFIMDYGEDVIISQDGDNFEIQLYDD